MVKIALQLKVSLEFVDKLYTNHPEHGWFLKLKCSSCGEVSEKFHYLTEFEKISQANKKADTNLAMKCKLCSRENIINIVKNSNGVITGDDVDYKTLVVFDCRGVEPVDYEPRDGWIAEATDNGPKFDNVDLTTKEWTEFDEINNVCLGIYEMEWRFIKVK